MRISVANSEICRHRRNSSSGGGVSESLGCDEQRKIRADTQRIRREDGAMETKALTSQTPQSLVVDHLASPIGEMYAITDEQGRLRAFAWADHEYRGIQQLRRRHGSRIRVESGSVPASVRRAIEDYFAGDVHAVDNIECATDGTPFQQEVWSALRDIPAGTTLSYGALAVRIGKPNAVRAVGLANGSNPICIALPCHRVIGMDGSLTGYGGGLDRKRWLLGHEGVKGLLGNGPVALI
jgi:methylated-DNA-[protein]-cysteine S-methyltransferase